MRLLFKILSTQFLKYSLLFLVVFLALAMSSEAEDRLCRICFESVSSFRNWPDYLSSTCSTEWLLFLQDQSEDSLISPCICQGSQKYIHLSCLKTWQRTVLLNQHNHPAMSGDESRCDVNFSLLGTWNKCLSVDMSNAQFANLTLTSLPRQEWNFW